MFLSFRATTLASVLALSMVSASAGLVGNSVNLAATATPGTTILSATPNAAVVGAGAEFFVCVGPAGNACTTSGLSVSIDILDTAINFSFSGSTTGQATGPFTIDLTGFDSAITNVLLGSSNPFPSDSFGLDSFTSSSIRFVGNPAPNPGFNATGGRSYSFNVTTATTAQAVPEPASIALVGLALASLGLSRRRKR